MVNLKHRVFFALAPDDDVRRCLVAAAAGISGRRVSAADVHLTLVFLGLVDSMRLVDAIAAGDEVAGTGFDLTLDRIEYWKRPRVLCLTSSVMPAALSQLVDDLSARLRRAEFALETRVFRPHVTLLRDVRQAPIADFESTELHWPVSSFCLMESREGVAGSRYAALKTWGLACG